MAAKMLIFNGFRQVFLSKWVYYSFESFSLYSMLISEKIPTKWGINQVCRMKLIFSQSDIEHKKRVRAKNEICCKSSCWLENHPILLISIPGIHWCNQISCATHIFGKKKKSKWLPKGFIWLFLKGFHLQKSLVLIWEVFVVFHVNKYKNTYKISSFTSF